ncbi:MULTISPECIES: hypothetical protein [Xanthomonas]|uniref:hypothetical protein n=1 Tax=Xanthomonas TaxID=338 RepID=UPI0011C391AE|nr:MULTISPECIES: hypothetical protein [Xanthomonas]CAD1790669.1 hypothetical protein XSP_001702 [Xanthomonas sp. CPBF 426]CAG2088499.1 hypothetical protein XCY_001666 [Xanthomonas euroxanthea]
MRSVIPHLRNERLFVNMKAEKIEGASLYWLNESCLDDIASSLGVKTLDECREKILRRYALRLTDVNFKTASAEVYADYYGSSGVTYFGGSGRAAVVDAVQIKGIGKTPLISSYTNWFHSNGAVGLSEAVREAIYSSIMAREFPFETVPVWGIINCGDTISMPDGKNISRALIIRPFVLRPSHVERALAYGHTKESFNRSFHVQDIARVKAWIPIAFPYGKISLLALAERLGAQCAHAHVYHWYHGGWFSSITDVGGRLIDFGSTRSVESWLSLSHEPGEPPFGSEVEYCKRTLRSVSGMLERYGGLRNEMQLAIHVFNEAYKSSVLNALKRVLRSSVDLGEIEFDEFQTHFKRAQRGSSSLEAVEVERSFYIKLGVSKKIPIFFSPALSREAVEEDAYFIEKGNWYKSSQSAIDKLIALHVEDRDILR